MRECACPLDELLIQHTETGVSFLLNVLYTNAKLFNEIICRDVKGSYRVNTCYQFIKKTQINRSEDG